MHNNDDTNSYGGGEVHPNCNPNPNRNSKAAITPTLKYETLTLTTLSRWIYGNSRKNSNIDTFLLRVDYVHHD